MSGPVRFVGKHRTSSHAEDGPPLLRGPELFLRGVERDDWDGARRMVPVPPSRLWNVKLLVSILKVESWRVFVPAAQRGACR